MSERKIFGDFQTPPRLAAEAVALVAELFPQPDLVVEPTCGQGAFIEAALQHWGRQQVEYEGYEINGEYVHQATQRLRPLGATVQQQDFFERDWRQSLRRPHCKRVLVIGNPPWATNSDLGRWGGDNLPTKTNEPGYRGMDARTGKANFDIAEWMLARLIDAIPEEGCVAMLCKTMTARRVLRNHWKNGAARKGARLFRFDAKATFDVSADACLFFVTGEPADERAATVFGGLSLTTESRRFGFMDDTLVSDMRAYSMHRQLGSGSSHYTWRSGIKHDAAQIMEFVREGKRFRNGLGETVELERDVVFPLLKSSDLGNGRVEPRRYVLVTQRHTSDDTSRLRQLAPLAWTYLAKHSDPLDNRGSSVYRGQPRFAMFGVGPYSFAPWKVAISSFYKSLEFAVIPPHGGQPVMVDDTCCLLACECEREARLLFELLSAKPAKAFLRSLVFLDSKRPVTIDVLRRISLPAVARQLRRSDELQQFIRQQELDFGPSQRTFATA